MSKSDYISKLDENAERRFFSLSSEGIQVREEGDSRVIEGIAAVVNRTTDLGWFEERIDPGAFEGRLEDDVVALFNHDPNYPLARTTATGESKLELYTDDTGNLAYRFTAPNTTVGNDLLENIRSGVISKSSFAFTIEKEEWSEGDEADLRTIKKIKRLYDVSPVTYPAYSDTTVAARNCEKEHEKKLDLRRFKRRLFNLKYKINND